MPGYQELRDAIFAICPNAIFSEDADGELIVATGYAERVKDGRIILVEV